MALPATVGSGLSWSDHLSGRPGPFQGRSTTIQQTTQNTSTPFANAAASARQGQTFTPAADGVVAAVALSLLKSGSPAPDYIVELFATSGGLPTGSALATARVSGTSIGTTAAEYVFEFDNKVAVTSGTMYALTIRRGDGGTDAVNTVSIRTNSAGGYAGGTRVTYNSTTTTWSTQSDDCYFKIITLTNNLYVVAADKTNNHVEVWKSTDSGQTWSEVDSANHKSISSTVTFKSFDAVMVGATIVIAYITGASTNSFVDFDVEADTWGTPVASTHGVTHIVDNTGQCPISVARRANGDTIVARMANYVNMTTFRQPYYDRYVGGSWTNSTAVGPGTQINTDLRPILTDGSIVLFQYVEVAGDDTFSRALSSANALGTANTTDTTAHGSGTYLIGSGVFDGTEFNVPSLESTNDAINRRITVSGNTITVAAGNLFTATTVTNPEPLTHAITLVNVSGTIHAFWINDNQTEIDRDNDAGTNTWGTDTAWKTAQFANEASTANFPIQGGSGVGASEAVAQSFTADGAKQLTLDNISARMFKTGSPTDNITATIRTGSQTGTVVATSSALALSSVTAIGDYNFTFSSPFTLTGGTKYWIVFERSGARDTVNYPQIYYTTANPVANGAATTRGTGTWSAEGVDDLRMALPGQFFAIAAEPVSIGGSSVGVLYLEGGTVKYDSYPQSSVGTTFDVPVATASAAGLAPAMALQAVTPAAAASGAGLAPRLALVTPAAAASGAGLAPAARLQAGVPAAAASGAALAPILALPAPAAAASGSGLAPSARIVAGVPAASAGAAGLAGSMQAIAAPPAAAASGAGLGPTVTSTFGVPAATATGVGLDPTFDTGAPSDTFVVPVATAAAAGAAPAMSLVAAAPAATASGQGLAPAAVVQVPSPAAAASAAGLAPAAAVRASPPAATATGQGLAPTSKATLIVPLAPASALGLAPQLALRVPLATASALGLAPSMRSTFVTPAATALAAMLAVSFGLRVPVAIATAQGRTVTMQLVVTIPVATALAFGLVPDVPAISGPKGPSFQAWAA